MTFGDRGSARRKRSAFIALVLSAGLGTATTANAQVTFCLDLDADGYSAGPACVVAPFDCSDQDPAVHPGAIETCNGWDDDCDGISDPGCNTCPDFQQTRRLLIKSNASSGRIATAPNGWAYIFSDGGIEGWPEIATRLDLRGEGLSPQTAVSGPTYIDSAPKDPEVCWSGSEMSAAWRGANSHLGVFFRRLGPWGKPPAEITTITPFDGSDDGLLWNGYQYALVWNAFGGFSPNGARIARVSSDGLSVNHDGVLSPLPHEQTITWDGNGYGWAFYATDAVTQHTEVYFQRFSADVVPVTNVVRLTDHTGGPPSAYASLPIVRSKGPGQGYGILWLDTRTGLDQVWFAVIRPDGTVANPPGEVQVSFQTKRIAVQFDLGWSGGEFFAVWTNTDASNVGTGVIMGARISADGTVLERKPITAGPDDDEPRVAWNGRSWGLAVEKGAGFPNPEVYFVEVGCRCSTDGDADGVLPCAGGDCDDGDPSVAAGKPEACTDGKDNNCDGLVDCNDPTCVQNGNPPAEIAGLLFPSGKATIQWTGDTKATGYDVARGMLSDLRDMENFRWAACMASRVTGTSISDGTVPAPGSGFYYLVRGRARTCLLGAWGTGLREGTLHGCP